MFFTARFIKGNREKSVSVRALFCGHTHRRMIGEVVPGFMDVNVGSDYDDLKTFTLEV